MQFYRFKFYLLLFLTTIIYNQSYSQEPTKEKPIFFGDFRFREEQDWDSRSSDGSYRDDRNRLRYRFRLGVKYNYKDWAQVGARIRTGNLNDQQGPHVTLGGDSKEFGLVQMGFEKLYFKANYKSISGWIGKNSFPFAKQNELFWNDNVFVEGVALSLSNFSEHHLLKNVQINLGHFIYESKGSGLEQDGYMQVVQIVEKWKNTMFYVGYFGFNNVPNIPDGEGTFNIGYDIINLGGKWNFGSTKKYRIGFDAYLNLSNNNYLSEEYSDETLGVVPSIGIGKLEKPKDFSFDIIYAYLEKIAVVDYFAQNDWARWDYSSYGASGSRLTNFQGIELKVGYLINKQMNLIFRAYRVEQLKALGDFKESGSRARLDFNFKF